MVYLLYYYKRRNHAGIWTATVATITIIVTSLVFISISITVKG